jgi:hypothetical protein
VSVFKNEGWAWMDRMTELARENGIYLIVDLHAPPGGYQGPTGATAAYFTNADLRKRTENFWVAFAQRYRHEPIIAAYDLINEPRPRTNADWYTEAERLTAAIRDQGGDSNHLVLVESPFPTDGNGFEIVRIADTAGRVLYDTHYYSPGGFTFNSDTGSTYVSTNTNLSDGIFGELSFVQSDAWDDTIVGIMVPTVYDMSESEAFGIYAGQLTAHERSEALPPLAGSNAAPINIGEFGVKLGTFQRAEAAVLSYLTDLHQVMDSYGVSRQQWNFRGDMGLYSTFAGFHRVARLRNEALHQFLVSLKTSRAAMRKPQDFDNDGMADLWERSKFGAVTVSDGTGDADHDGSSDLAEYLAGTGPSDPATSYRARLALPGSGPATLEWDAIPWREYVVERATELAPENFAPIATRRAASRGTIQFTDESPPSGTRVFYRVRVIE